MFNLSFKYHQKYSTILCEQSETRDRAIMKLINFFNLSFKKKLDLEVLLKQIEEIKEGTAEERERIFQKFSF